jgi:hypothetical protein
MILRQPEQGRDNTRSLQEVRGTLLWRWEGRHSVNASPWMGEEKRHCTFSSPQEHTSIPWRTVSIVQNQYTRRLTDQI